MYKILFLAIFSFLCTVVKAEEIIVYSNHDTRIIQEALKFVENKKWADAIRVSKQAHDRLVPNIFMWLRYRQDSALSSFEELTNFAKGKNIIASDEILLRKIEDHAVMSKNDNLVLEWFTKHKPETAAGKIRYLEAKIALGINKENISSFVKNVWINDNFSKLSEKLFLQKYGSYLTTDDHVRKIDRLIWQRDIEKAKDLLVNVDNSYRRYFTTRLKLIAKVRTAVADYNSLTPFFKKQSGIQYDLAEWYQSNKDEKNLRKILEYYPKHSEFNDKWWAKRAQYVRNLIEDENYKMAYHFASDHHMKHTNSKYPDAEWLSGWVALRFLKNTELALKHFKNFNKVVSRPISQSRAAYWLGRTFEVKGDKENADSFYSMAALYPSTYYGQLALHKLSHTPEFHPKHLYAVYNDEDKTALKQNMFFKMAYLLSMSNKYETLELARKYIASAVTHAKTKGEVVLITKAVLDAKKYSLAIEASKHASYRRIPLIEFNFPRSQIIANFVTNNSTVDNALVHSIIKQESMFVPTAESYAGAMGLMQLMPDTAKSVCKKSKEKYEVTKLKSTPLYNVKLGTHLLKYHLDRYNGSYLLTAAAYNCGEAPVDSWIKRFGDPRKMDDLDDVVDWVESITYSQTRDYVQRVMESVQIYRNLFDNNSKFKIELAKDLRLGYSRSEG